MSVIAANAVLRRVRGSALISALLLLVGCEAGPQYSVDPSTNDRGIASSDAAALTADRVVPTGQSCSPTGNHFEHRSYACAACHQCAGTVSFDAAVAGPNAAFDATSKNCSNIACHGVVSGTFTYSVWDWGIEDLVQVSVPYGGTSAGSVNWYAPPGQGCTTCHGYPPKYNGVAYAWHGGTHGLNIPNGNNCKLCHPDATGAYVYGGSPSYVGTSGGLIASCPPGTYCSAPGTITNPALHRNGVLDVSPVWTGKCFGCH
jgi:hypothetical protein